MNPAIGKFFDDLVEKKGLGYAMSVKVLGITMAYSKVAVHVAIPEHKMRLITASSEAMAIVNTVVHVLADKVDGRPPDFDEMTKDVKTLNDIIKGAVKPGYPDDKEVTDTKEADATLAAIFSRAKGMGQA